MSRLQKTRRRRGDGEEKVNGCPWRNINRGAIMSYETQLTDERQLGSAEITPA